MWWGWRGAWVPLGVRTTWGLPTVMAACTLPADTLHSRGQHLCVCVCLQNTLHTKNVKLNVFMSVVLLTFFFFKSECDISPLPPLLYIRHDGYSQQYPGMPYGMHPSGMYPQQQVRDNSVCTQHSLSLTVRWKYNRFTVFTVTSCIYDNVPTCYG